MRDSLIRRPFLKRFGISIFLFIRSPYLKKFQAVDSGKLIIQPTEQYLKAILHRHLPLQGWLFAEPAAVLERQPGFRAASDINQPLLTSKVFYRVPGSKQAFNVINLFLGCLLGRHIMGFLACNFIELFL